jgi:thiol-disulfide isomerase/thioredoxin
MQATGGMVVNRGKGYKQRFTVKFAGVVCLLLMAALHLSPPISAAEARKETETPEAVFAHGPGPVEVLFFTDYFCPPCRALEPYLEEVLPNLLPLGVRVSFVDMPFSRQAPLYARYFLYAAKASPSLEGVLHARNALIDIAVANTVASDQEMIQALKEKRIKIEYFDLRPDLGRWSEIIRKYNVRSTPTCIVLRPGQEAEHFVGSGDIPAALDRLFEELSGVARHSAKPQE